MNAKEFSDFSLSLNLNLEVDVTLRKISELVKLISAHSRQCPDHLISVVDCLDTCRRELSAYIESNFVKDEEKH